MRPMRSAAQLVASVLCPIIIFKDFQSNFYKKFNPVRPVRPEASK